MFGSSLSPVRRAASAAVLALVLTTSACGSDAPATAPSTPAPVASASAPASTSAAQTSVAVSSEAAPQTSDSPATDEPSESGAVPPVTDRPAAEAAVSAWTAEQMGITTGETIDPTCVSGYVAQLSDEDLAVLAAAAAAGDDMDQELSEDGQLIGNGLSTCVPSMNTAAPSGDATGTDRETAEAKAMVYVHSAFTAAGNAPDSACVAQVLGQFSDEDLALIADSAPGDPLPTLSAEGTAISDGFGACVVAPTS